MSDAVLFVIKYGPQDGAHQDDGERRAAFRADIADGLIALLELPAEYRNRYSYKRGRLEVAIQDCVLELKNFGDVDWSATNVVTLTSKGHERVEDVLRIIEIVDVGILERIQRGKPRRCPPVEEAVELPNPRLETAKPAESLTPLELASHPLQPTPPLEPPRAAGFRDQGGPVPVEVQNRTKTQAARIRLRQLFRQLSRGYSQWRTAWRMPTFPANIRLLIGKDQFSAVLT
jgi:hypothetical protein